MEGIGRAGTTAQAWNELLTLSRDETSERQMLERLLDLWCREHGAEAAGLYLERGGALEQETAVGDGLPDAIDGSALASDLGGLGSLAFHGGRLLYAPGTAGDAAANDPLTLLLAAALKR